MKSHHFCACSLVIRARWIHALGSGKDYLLVGTAPFRHDGSHLLPCIFVGRVCLEDGAEEAPHHVRLLRKEIPLGGEERVRWRIWSHVVAGSVQVEMTKSQPFHQHGELG